MTIAGDTHGSDKAGWFSVERRTIPALLGLAGNVVRVYLAMRYYADDKTRLTYPSLVTVGKLTGLHPGSVSRATKTLRKAHFLEELEPGRKGRSTRYKWVAPAQPSGGNGLRQRALFIAPARDIRCASATRSRIRDQASASSIDAAAAQMRAPGRKGLMAAHGERVVLAAEAEIQRRIAAGRKIHNPGGLLRVLLRDGFTPPPPPPRQHTAAELAARKAAHELSQETLRDLIYADLAIERRKYKETRGKPAGKPLPPERPPLSAVEIRRRKNELLMTLSPGSTP